MYLYFQEEASEDEEVPVKKIKEEKSPELEKKKKPIIKSHKRSPRKRSDSESNSSSKSSDESSEPEHETEEEKQQRMVSTWCKSQVGSKSGSSER